MLAFFSTNNALAPHQFGFRPKRSVAAQMLCCLNQWTKGVDSGNAVDVLYLDYKKAFDSVSHVKLLHKLDHVGIRGNLLKWFENYLHLRTQSVRIDGQFSEPLSVSSSVPQGSCLGPILFLVYCNDFGYDFTNADVSMYADDSKVFCCFAKTVTNPPLNDSIAKIENWCSEWQLSLSVEKCKVLHLGNQSDPFEYYLYDAKVEPVTVMRDLGIMISSDLKSETHIQLITKKAYARANQIFRSFTYSDFDTLLKAYIIYVRPMVETDTVVWSPHYVKDIEAVEKVQRYCTRRIYQKCGLVKPDYETRLAACGLDTLVKRRTIADLVFVFKLCTRMIDLDMSALFDQVENPTAVLRGNSVRLQFNHCRLDIRKYFFCSRTVTLWNSLPINPHVLPMPKDLPGEQKYTTSIVAFRSFLSKHLKGQQFYSFD